MPIRFRKTIRLGPLLRLNLSRSGWSWSIGPRGASFNTRRRRARVDLPGPFSYESPTLPREEEESAG